ncbi:hypothetical protein WJX84_009930 [Apatococcus fuscideae]|uniref:Rab-GAP TBC domain-containing protein n=1 Tax=Apatococcus fuscideae TaxID=2026836 RepID=A0AAW1SVX8_9CHLO
MLVVGVAAGMGLLLEEDGMNAEQATLMYTRQVFAKLCEVQQVQLRLESRLVGLLLEGIGWVDHCRGEPPEPMDFTAQMVVQRCSSMHQPMIGGHAADMDENDESTPSRVTDGLSGIEHDEEEYLDEGRLRGFSKRGPLVEGQSWSASSYDDCQGVRDLAVNSHPIVAGQDSIAEETTAATFFLMDDMTDPGSETETVYAKDGVAIFPAKAERITGRLSLLKLHQVLFLSCCRPRSNHVRGAPHSSVGGEGHQEATPSFGWQHIVIILQNGLTLPPFYFSNGGIKALFAALKQHANLVKSAGMLSPDRALAAGIPVNFPSSYSGRLVAATSLCSSGALPSSPAAGLQHHLILLHSSVMSSQACLVRAQACQWFQSRLHRTRPSLPPSPWAHPPSPSPARSSHPVPLLRPAIVCDSVPKTQPLPDGMGGLAQAWHPHPPPAKWGSTTQRGRTHSQQSGSVQQGGDCGRLVDEPAFQATRVLNSGIAPAVRREAWKFLLGIYSAKESSRERRPAMTDMRAEYEKLKAQ